MTRLRWGLAGATAVLTLVAAIQSLRAYAAHDLTLGTWAVVGLALLLIVGLASLGWARRRIGGELTALSGAGPAGELERARRQRLQVIKAADAIPDREALAEAARANEAGRAYVGRFLVATTVLIGLVGTFAGLMETLGKVAPLLRDNDAGGIALLAAPLGGLHVTFGATLVAILATLSLALAQGDLTLAEERALATLEDRTTHEWIPQLWPRGEDAAERTARAMDGLRTTLAEAVAGAIEASVKRLADAARGDSERASRALEQTTTAVEKQISALSALLGRAAEESARKQGDLLATAASRQTAALEGAAGRVEARVTEAVQKIAGGLDAQMERALASVAAAGRTTLLGVQQAAESAVERHAATTESAIARVSELTVTSLGRATEAAVTASERAVETAAKASERATEAAVKASQRAAETATEASGRAGEAATKASERAAEAATAASERAVGAAEEAARRYTALAEQTAQQASAWGEESHRRSTERSEQLLRETTAIAEKALGGTTEAVVRTLEPLFAEEGARLESLRGALADTTARVEVSVGRIGELSTSLDGVAREQVAALDRHGQTLLAAFDRVVVGGGTALTESAGTLAAAARQLQGSTDLLAPRLEALSTELGALAREVALMLAARGPDGDVGAIVLGELERLGAGFDRLSELVRMARAEGDAHAASASDTAPAPQVEAPVAPAESSSEGPTEISSDGAATAVVEDGAPPVEDAVPAVDSPDPERA